MASSKQQKGAPLIDIQLIFRYTGIKATQYFSKTSPESDEVFRNDLTALKLPHPKRENTHILLPGCVVCQWIGVQLNGVLHKHISTKCHPSEDVLRELSIISITVKYNTPPLPPDHLPTKKNLKRPRPDLADAHMPIQPMSSVSSAQAGPSNPPTAWNKNPASSHAVWDDRPHKKARLGPDASSSSVSQQSPTFPTFTNLPPLLPRTQGPLNARVFVPNKPPKGTGVAQGAELSSSTSMAKDIPTVPQHQASVVKNKPPSGHVNKFQSSASNPSQETRFRVKQEPNDSDDFLLLQPQPKPPERSTLQPNQPPVPSRSSRFQPTSSAVEASNAQLESDTPKGDILVQKFLESLNLKTETKKQRQEMTTAPPTHQEPQKTLSLDSQDAVPPACPIKSTNPPVSRFSAKPDWYTSSEVPPFRGPGEVVETMRNVTSPTTTSTFQPVNTPSKSPLEGSAYPPPPSPIKIQTSTSSTNSTRTEHPEDKTNDDMGPYRRNGPRPQILDSDKAAAQRLQRELFDIKREINAKVVREADVIAQLKQLNVRSIPEPVKIGHDPSEEMRDELARLEHELAAERKLREEAECIIADIRREMKAPFVVPSLFDAFVKLSRLTTQGLRAGEAASVSEATGPATSDSTATPAPTDDMSVSPIE